MSDKSAASLPELATGNFEAPSRRRLVASAYEICLLILVFLTVYCETAYDIDPAIKLQPMTVLGMVIPPWVLMLPAVSTSLKLLVFTALALWVLKKGTRWVYIAAPILFISYMSTAAETAYFVHHQSHFCAIAFALMGAAKFWGSAPGKTEAINSNAAQSSSVDPLPRWCYMLLIYYIGISYTFAGCTKLYYSGFSWGDGSSLMMWLDALGQNRDNLLFDLLTKHHWLASILQTTTLVAEVAGILVLFMPRMRPVLGLVFVGFHLSIELLFSYNFFSNVFLDTVSYTHLTLPTTPYV